MKRRGFLKSLLLAGAGFSILPGALTYARNWKPAGSGLLVPNPDWVTAEFEYYYIDLGMAISSRDLYGKWKWVQGEERAVVADEAISQNPNWKLMNPVRFKLENGVMRQVHPFTRLK